MKGVGREVLVAAEQECRSWLHLPARAGCHGFPRKGAGNMVPFKMPG